MKLLFTLILITGFSLGLSAQNLILMRGGTVVSNDSIYLTGNADANLLSFNIAVGNESDQPIDVGAKKEELELVNGTTNTFCWAGVCFVPTVYVASKTLNISSKGTDSTSFVADYQPSGLTGTSVIRYTFYNNANQSDQVTVTAFFQVNASGIDHHNVTKPWFRVYPNPVDDRLTILVAQSAIGQVTATLINVQGQVMRTEKAAPGSRSFNFMTAEYPTGIYFVQLYDESGWRAVQKIWVRH